MGDVAQKRDSARDLSRSPRGVAVGMSGGMDSCVAAWILKQRGYRVVGVTLRFFGRCARSTAAGAPCSETSLRHAGEFCERFDIPHHVVPVEDEFEGIVVRSFFEEYGRGRTPNPCVTCNARVKFPVLARTADHLGLEMVATGHYARIVHASGNRVFLSRARDRGKDQSYFLYRVPVTLLHRSLFPAGEMKKSEVRALAGRLGAECGPLRESQDVCFIARGGLHAFLREHVGSHCGEIVDEHGRVLGQHRGVAFFTVGQRRGLGIASPAPLYVKRIDAERNRIVVSRDRHIRSQAALCSGLKLRTRSLHGRFFAKIRYRHPPAPVRSIELFEGGMLVQFSEPQRAVTPGQSLVLYRDDAVVGGGVIEEAVES